MTHPYRPVWNKAHACWVAVSECARSCGTLGSSVSRVIRRRSQSQAKEWFGLSPPAPPLPRPGDPPRPYTTCTDSFCDTLTLDQTGGSFYTWSFSKNYRPSAAVRGHGMLGNLSASRDTFAWTVWVR